MGRCVLYFCSHSKGSLSLLAAEILIEVPQKLFLQYNLQREARTARPLHSDRSAVLDVPDLPFVCFTQIFFSFSLDNGHKMFSMNHSKTHCAGSLYLVRANAITFNVCVCTPVRNDIIYIYEI